MILQKVYHELQAWIVMLNTSEFANTDAEIVREEMMKLCGEIWMNQGKENAKGSEE